MSGISTNTDINSLIQQYSQIWQTKYITPLVTKKTTLQKQKQAFDSLDTLLTTLKTKAEDLQKSDAFLAKKAEISDTNVLTAKITNATTVNAGNYFLNVIQLAKAHKAGSNQFSNSGVDIIIQEGSGNKSFRITLNGVNTDIQVTLNENDTNQAILKNIAFKINASAADVTASIVNESSSSSRLIITSNQTGAANTLSLQDSTGSLLRKSDFLNGNGTLRNELQVAKDSIFTIDGLNFQRSTNKIDDALSGISLNLLKESSSTEVKVSSDTQSIQGVIQNFLTAYNNAADYLKKEGSYNLSTKTAGSLVNANFDRQIPNRLKEFLFLPLNSLPAGLNSLFSLGIGSDGAGKFVIKDEDLLKEKLLNNSQAVADIFNTANEGISVKMDKYLSRIIGTSSERIANSISGVEKKIEEKNKGLASYTKTLERKFSDLEKRLMINNSYMSQYTQGSSNSGFSLYG